MESVPEANKDFNYNSMFSYYLGTFSQEITDFSYKRRRATIPKIPLPILKQLLVDVRGIFNAEPIVLQVPVPQVIVGDLHGHLFDLFRILKYHHAPPTTNYVFLGDYVDRGSFSLETVTLVFLMKILFPKNVFVIRGNHEFRELCSVSGFFSELTAVYQDKAIQSLFLEVFSVMPLACVIDDYAICVHGGLGPTLTSVSTIAQTDRPLYEFPNGPTTDLLWSDPSDFTRDFHPSSRGSGHLFGSDALDPFLKNEKLSVMIRGHQCVMGGVQYQLMNHCITVFSASNYCGTTHNKAGTLTIGLNHEHKTTLFDPLPILRRTDVTLALSESETEFIINFMPPLQLLKKYQFSEVSSSREKFDFQIEQPPKLPELRNTARDQVRRPRVGAKKKKPGVDVWTRLSQESSRAKTSLS